MLYSIHHFLEKEIPNLTESITNFYKTLNLAEFILEIKEVILKLGCEIIKETLESEDQMLRESGKRKIKWEVVRLDEKQLLTSLGNIRFEKTLFKNKETGERCYLLDRMLELDSHARITEDAHANILKEAVESSYEKAANAISLSDFVSRQTVKNKIHKLQFDKLEKEHPKKKEVKYLYIDADEAHVALQYRKEKGDLFKRANGTKGNCQIAKIIYVHEGIRNVDKDGKRREVINPHYFCGTYSGSKKNKELWEEVREYIENYYEREKIQTIYLNADGGSWINRGVEITGSILALDGFHAMRALKKVIQPIKKEEKNETEEKLMRWIREDKKYALKKWCEREKEKLPENKKNRYQKQVTYLLNHQKGIRIRLKKENGVIGSTTESHVSHVLADRMSSRPMGWSRMGVDQMAKLRAYYYNGGDMLELVRSQKKTAEPKPIKQEELSSSQIIASENKVSGENRKYIEILQHSISTLKRNQLYFQSQIWLL